MKLALPATALLLLAGSTACGSSAPATFYALSPESGAAQPASFHTIRLRRPGVAGYLDRPEIVRRIVDFRLGVIDTDRWAAPLDEMLGRVLAEDIEQRVPGSSVFTEDGAISADPDATIEVDLRRFDVGDTGEVNLVAEVAVEKQSTHTPAATRAVILRQIPASAATAALVATMSDLLGKLADQIAALLREGAREP
jgi:uncharacterized lipoprotein YmbA